jgi:prefoldin subunit 5
MQNIREVLRNKEEQLEKLQKEIEALRLSLRILEEEEPNTPKIGVRSVETMPANDNGNQKTGTGVRQFP